MPTDRPDLGEARPPQVGICIPTRNQAEFIVDALRSAFAQTAAIYDVIVCDDAGTDNTAEVVARFRSTLDPDRRPLLRYERNAQALGIGGNFNRAVRLSRGEFCVKLDSDDLLEPNFAEALATRLAQTPSAGWAHANVLNIRPEGTSLGLAHTRKKTGFYSADAALPDYLVRNDTCHCVMLRRTAYEAVGGYRPEMKTCEDWLLWLEMLFAGWGYCFDARPLARMRKYDTRPELMTRRRLAFVDSARIMALRLQTLCAAGPQTKGKLSAADAWHRFRHSLAGLCADSGCDEGDPTTRRALFEAAVDFAPLTRQKRGLAVVSRLPPILVRTFSRWRGLPRNFARQAVQRLRAMLSHTPIPAAKQP